MDPEIARYVIGGLALAVTSLAGVVFKLQSDHIAKQDSKIQDLEAKNLTMVESNMKTVTILQAMVEDYRARELTATQTSNRSARTP